MSLLRRLSRRAIVMRICPGRRGDQYALCVDPLCRTIITWLTRADCDLEILTFSPVIEGGPVISSRFALIALAWAAKGGDSGFGLQRSLRRPRGGAPLGRRGQRRASGWA